MIAQGDTIGLLYLSFPQPGTLTPAKKQLARTVAEHLSLALANLKLRETLRNQSIRDPLTGLFNRRYMQESLEREIYRAQRQNQMLGIMMIDIDHFKQFNDTFGHDAGDFVLQTLGQFLQEKIRGSDIACRYGGEEFMLILPEVSLESLQRRAEEIRQGVTQLKLERYGQTLEVITVSIGVACFPNHGISSDPVIQAADMALYQAKNLGRNRVVVGEN